MKFIQSLLLSVLLYGIVFTAEIFYEECAYYVDGACYHYGNFVAPPPAPDTPPAPVWQLAKEETKFHATRDSIAKIKNFVVNLNASIKTVRRHNVSIGLNRNDPVWNEFEQMAANGGWEDQTEWNAAMTKVKEEIKRVYAMEWTPNNANKRQGPDNWAYALFLLRALLEFFKDIFNKAKGNAQLHYIFCMANVVPGGAYNPACLDDPIAKNAENIGFIDQWFTNYNRAPATAKTHYTDYNTRIVDHFNVVIVPTGPFTHPHPFMGYPFVGGMAPPPNGGAYAAYHYYRIPAPAAAPAPAPAPAAPAIVLDKQNVSIELSPDTKTDIENFIKKFNEKLPMSGNNANKTLYYNNDLFYAFLKKINSQWVGQKTINAAFHRIREFINAAYGLHQEKRGKMRRKWQENWTFDMFMLRALFELFKAIIGAAQTQMGTLAQMNNDNIAKIDEWFTQLAANSSVLRPEALQIFQKGQQNWADFKTKIDNVFVATVTIPAAAAPAPSAPPMPHAGGYYAYQHAYYPPHPNGGGFMHPHPAAWMMGMGMA